LIGALSRPRLVYPLASFDVSGQRPVSRADASPNEVPSCISYYATPAASCQETQSPPNKTLI